MTKPWRDMTDRERDALVCEAVFDAPVEWYDVNFGDEEPSPFDMSKADAGNDTGELVSHYSTDIAAAWRVVEALQHQGMTVEVYNGSRGGCTVKILDFEKGQKWGSASVDGAPEAICLAALKAAGYEGEV